MDNRLMINQPIRPVKQVNNQQQIHQKKQTDKPSFKNVLLDRLKQESGVEFSKHARNRLISRGINLTETELNQLKSGVAKAEEKGAKDSLIMVNNVAYVVSIENRTVITAIDDNNLKENVFTNIDSAVFM